MWTQQIERFILIIKVYIIWRSPEVKLMSVENLYMICINVFLESSEKKGLKTLQKNIANFCRPLRSFYSYLILDNCKSVVNRTVKISLI